MYSTAGEELTEQPVLEVEGATQRKLVMKCSFTPLSDAKYAYIMSLYAGDTLIGSPEGPFEATSADMATRSIDVEAGQQIMDGVRITICCFRSILGQGSGSRLACMCYHGQ